MEVSIRSDNVIVQFGESLGERDDCTIETVDEALLAQLQQVGVKTLQADGTILVTPLDTSVEDAARAAAEAEK